MKAQCFMCSKMADCSSFSTGKEQTHGFFCCGNCWEKACIKYPFHNDSHGSHVGVWSGPLDEGSPWADKAYRDFEDRFDGL